MCCLIEVIKKFSFGSIFSLTIFLWPSSLIIPSSLSFHSVFSKYVYLFSKFPPFSKFISLFSKSNRQNPKLKLVFDPSSTRLLELGFQIGLIMKSLCQYSLTLKQRLIKKLVSIYCRVRSRLL